MLTRQKSFFMLKVRADGCLTSAATRVCGAETLNKAAAAADPESLILPMRMNAHAFV